MASRVPMTSWSGASPRDVARNRVRREPSPSASTWNTPRRLGAGPGSSGWDDAAAAEGAIVRAHGRASHIARPRYEPRTLDGPVLRRRLDLLPDRAIPGLRAA